MKNWSVTFYDKKDKIVETIILENKNEDEIEVEVKKEIVNRKNIIDWNKMELVD